MNKVVVAIEDEVFGQAIVEFLGRVSWPAESSFKLIHIVEPQPIIDAPPTYWQEALEHAVKSGEGLLNSLSSSLKAKTGLKSISTAVLEGFAKETILETAETWEADLIVMGSHGRRGLSRFLLGSVSTAVSENARCSTMIVRLAELQSDKKAKEKSAVKSN